MILRVTGNCSVHRLCLICKVQKPLNHAFLTNWWSGDATSDTAYAAILGISYCRSHRSLPAGSTSRLHIRTGLLFPGLPSSKIKVSNHCGYL